MEIIANKPLSAGNIIAELEKRIRGGKLCNNMRTIISILSKKNLSRDRFLERLRNAEYDFRGASDAQVICRLRVIRDYGVLGCQDGRYYIKGTEADPAIQDLAKKTSWPAKRNTGKPRSLRSIMYDVLKEEPLPVNQMAARVKDHPDYDETQKYADNILIVAQRALYANKSLFEREDPGRFSRWRIKAGSFPPPAGFHQNLRRERNELYQVMRTRLVIKGWTCLDLYEEVRRPDAKYQIKVGSSQDQVISALYQILSRDEKDYFEKIPAKGGIKRWRPRWQGSSKIPSAPMDFQDLAIKIIDDLGIAFLKLDELLKAVRQYGHLFGYEANGLPIVFLENNIVRAVADTEYARRIRS